MTVTYENTLEDLIEFQWFTCSRLPGNQRGFALLRFGMPILWVGLVFWSVTVVGMTLFNLVLLIAAGLWMWGWPRFQRWTIARSITRAHAAGGGALGKHTVTISEQGVREVTDAGETFTVWSGVTNVVATDRSVLLYLGPLLAHVIPRRAFVNERECNEFVQLAQQLCKAA